MSQPHTADLQTVVGQFFSLTPDKVLDAVEQSGHRTTGLCYPLNSLENRVYEVEQELEDSSDEEDPHHPQTSRWVAKFYRPGRWNKETILDEHRLLAALAEAEIPVCAPAPFPDGATLHTAEGGVFFTLFPRMGGRSPEDLSPEQYRQLGRLLGRIHNVAASLGLRHRPYIEPDTYGRQCLEIILERTAMSPGVQQRYADAVRRLVDVAQPRFEHAESIVVHGDCHRGNLLFGRDGWFFLDFDDMGHGPAVQDLWLLLPGSRQESKTELEAMLHGYEQFREFDHSTLGLIEVLRGLRYVRYAAWIASRWEDPSFQRAFPEWGTDRYWDGQVADLYEQLRRIQVEDQARWCQP